MGEVKCGEGDSGGVVPGLGWEVGEGAEGVEETGREDGDGWHFRGAKEGALHNVKEVFEPRA